MGTGSLAKIGSCATVATRRLDVRGIVNGERRRIRNLILNRPKRAAIELGIPYLAYYPGSRESPEFTLLDLGRRYLDKRRTEDGKGLTRKYKENTERAWNEFCKFVDVPYAREITPEKVEAYRASVMDAFNAGKSPAWVRVRFKAVRIILKHGLDHSHDKLDYRRALDECLILKSPTGRLNSTSISVEHLHTLLNVAPRTERAMLMLALNAVMSGGEVCALRRSEVDLTKGTLARRRSRNRYPRVARLWVRTVKAIRDYRREHPHHSPYLFVSETGDPFTSDGFRQRIVRIRRRAQRNKITIPEGVTVQALRDAAYQVAASADYHYAKFVVGHKTGMPDTYVLRQADHPRVIACCTAVEQHFFSPRSGGTRKPSRYSKAERGDT